MEYKFSGDLHYSITRSLHYSVTPLLGYSYATIWKSKQRDDDLKLRLNVDPHSPSEYRTNVPLSNMPEFQKAFALPDNSLMVRAADKRANIW